MEATVFRLRLELRNPFRIAHGTYSHRESVFLRLRSGGFEAYGEAPVVPYYGLSTDEIEADLRAGLSRRAVEEAMASLSAARAPFAHPVARSAFETAALSLRAAAEGRSLASLLGAGGGASPPSSYTVAYDEDGEAMVRVAASSGFRRLKLKAGIPGDVERVALIRERLPEAIIRVDANQGWSLEEAPAKLAALERLGVEFVEEPTAAAPADYARLAASTSLPLLLDESLRSAEDIARFAGAGLAGVVVKIAKNGGPAASASLARAAREAGMRAMVSCMVETSLGAGAALGLGPLCEWCDLDAPMLIANDPFVGFRYDEDRPAAPGGVKPGPELERLVDSLAPAVLGD